MHKNPFIPRKDRLRNAIALVPTLLVLALMSTVVILFFSVSRVYLQSSQDHSASYDLRHLQDTAINLVMAQIRAGSTEDGTLWISQPGAIRTYNQTGGPSQIYKLYSSSDMKVSASGLSSPAESNLAQDVPENWDAIPGAFADLNAPVIRKDGTISFPIVDPRALDPDGVETPEGFSFSDSHSVGGGKITGVVTSGPESSRRLPMPVSWLYVLKDGSLGSMDSTGKFIPFAGQSGASNENPIVGRIAFWTDDETTKVNVNTASEALYWDTPRCATPEDVEFAKSPPAKNEVQRFGGHPATTCLSTIFAPNRYLDPTNSADADLLREIYSMVPRVSAQGGILGGGGPVVFDEDRLYPTVDEFLLSPEHEEQPFFSDDPSKLKKLRFFLTANSRAPELTCAGSPRVCLWSIFWNDLDTHRTSFDRLAAFCATMGGKNYFFRRNGANTNLGEYNQTYTDQTSNGELYHYILRHGTDYNAGYPETLAVKSGRQNLATGVICFTEYMRQTNLHDTTIAANGKRVVPYGGAYLNSAWGTEIHGQVTKIARNQLPNTMYNELGGTSGQSSSTGVATNGIGRIFATSEVGIAFSLAAEHRPDGTKFNPDLVDLLELPEGFKAIQAASIFEGFNPAQGYTMTSPSSTAQLLEAHQLRLVTSIGERSFGGKVTNYDEANDTLTQETGTFSQRWGKNHGLCHTVAYMRSMAPDGPDDARKSAAEWWVGWGGSGGRWMYSGSDSTNNSHMNNWKPYDNDLDDPSRSLPNQYTRGFFLVPSDDTTVRLISKRSDNELRFRVGNQRNGDWGNHLSRMKVPSGMTIPVPEEPQTLAPTWGQRYLDARKDKFLNPEVVDPSDVVRTWVSRHGDHRLQYIRERENSMAATQFIFVPHPDWDPQEVGTDADEIPQVHSFTLPGGTPEPNATFRRGLVRGVDYPAEVLPDFTIDPDNDPTYSENRPAGYVYALDPTETRDWDTGTGVAPDGAYWNKSDDVAHQWKGSIPPYFSKAVWDGSTPDALDETPAPNQQMPSAVMFGSINSAAASGAQWTTYLFRPDITPRGHLGAPDRSITGNRAGAPPDHILLDWFWMPVVQPYAISSPFSTLGKLNMNYRIAPFTYINRATGLHAVLKSERLLAIPTSAGQTYKNYASASSNTGWRQPIDIQKTLVQWEEKFDSGEFFMNASEICEQFLVPKNKGISGSNSSALKSAMTSFWNSHLLTGDNVLERPYANIYPRLTTRSNSYRVHFLVQTISKARSSDPERFDPERDTITGESQGDALLEREIDPNDPDLLKEEFDFIKNTNFTSLDNLYTYRIRHLRRFNR